MRASLPGTSTRTWTSTLSAPHKELFRPRFSGPALKVGPEKRARPDGELMPSSSHSRLATGERCCEPASRMHRPSGEVSQGTRRSYHSISHDCVLEALRLADRGEQRLRPVSKTETTIFLFRAPGDEGHFAAVKISIHPVPRPGSPNPFYEPFCDILPGCGCEPGRFRGAVQKIYDVCVRPIQWELDWYVLASYLLPDHRTWN